MERIVNSHDRTLNFKFDNRLSVRLILGILFCVLLLSIYCENDRFFHCYRDADESVCGVRIKRLPFQFRGVGEYVQELSIERLLHAKVEVVSRSCGKHCNYKGYTLYIVSLDEKGHEKSHLIIDYDSSIHQSEMKDSAYESMQIVNDFIAKTKDPAFKNETLSITFETPYSGNLFFWLVIILMVATCFYMTSESLVTMDAGHAIVQLRFFNIFGMEAYPISKYSYMPHEVHTFSVQIKNSGNRQNKKSYDLALTTSDHKVVNIPSGVGESSLSAYYGYVAQLNTALGILKDRPEALIEQQSDGPISLSAPSSALESNDGEASADGQTQAEQESPLTKDCRICWDSRASEIFLPCGHVVACLHCSRRVSDCPLCRRKIERYQTIRQVTT